MKENETHYSNMLSYRYADQVSVGDEVMVLRKDKLMPAKVMDVSSLIVQGNNSSSNLFVFLLFFPIMWIKNWCSSCMLSLLLLLFKYTSKR